MSIPSFYRGRLAPTPSGYLHLGHARTFWVAQERARQGGGEIILRNDDLDVQRVRREFVQGMIEDLQWFGFEWAEGPDRVGHYGPYNQSERRYFYLHIWAQLAENGCIYPSPHSRRDVECALRAPHEGECEPVFPPELRPELGSWVPTATPGLMNWRFRVRDGERITFHDGCAGERTYVAGVDFGDFLVWRKDDSASYELACVTDDHAMCISEVVRGDDLLLSTARQYLLYRALGWAPPLFYHVPLVRDASGERLAKRNHSLALRTLRDEGYSPEQLRSSWLHLTVS
ncbi:MAG: glutamate--tRNA ligase family protein [Verrucomicrobiota bacterium]|nr:glutamate--tRNA ligase family protein [Verrucomicrobiota bacterium]